MSTLTLSGITKSFADNDILKGIDLQAHEGEFIALVGPSGCGKSTLLRIVAGLEQATTGSVRVAGREVTALAPAERNVAMVFQSYALYPHLTAGQNIAVPLAMRQLSRLGRLPLIGALAPGQKAIRKEIQAKVREMARSLMIEHLIDRKPGQMSGGQRQRVALARAMVRRPALFLMDEPLSNLDAHLRVHARTEIVDLHRRAGVPTLYVTHDQAEALSMADRVAVMIGGRLLQLAPPQQIYADPRHIEVARFIGQPRINSLASRVTEEGMVRFGPAALSPAAALRAGTAVTLAIRPEHLRVLPRQTGVETGGLPGQVERLEFLGSEVIVSVRLDGMGETLLAKLAPAEAAPLATGQPVGLLPEADHLLVFDEAGHRIDAMPVLAQLRENAHG
ncbi:glycerol-3-phosphate ABC transporter ATP-binding protein [Rhizobium rhizosphaerae]|uniref:Glycerol-3-phosphate ABC transporter ATP-binding protein n=1 Tax=Xaviernesmea rhizosphaerae TaxID=1672749 RepID=A0ABX3PAV4_9HYPH|nr:ABC transporter ATP-binding protein [Xaviernesmea rhizosphaerae]OQP85052.1 glycerol-3-phosphate ABC transporter ATP-binding protein [Xaviernesmea rhizosphaerae]